MFKEAVGRFAKTQSDRVGDASVYVQTLFSRVQAHAEQIYDGQYHAQEILEAFGSRCNSTWNSFLVRSP